MILNKRRKFQVEERQAKATLLREEGDSTSKWVDVAPGTTGKLLF